MYIVTKQSQSPCGTLADIIVKVQTRPEPIMLFKLPIMLLSNAPKFSLLCPNYAPLCPIMLHYAPANAVMYLSMKINLFL